MYGTMKTKPNEDKPKNNASPLTKYSFFFGVRFFFNVVPSSSEYQMAASEFTPVDTVLKTFFISYSFNRFYSNGARSNGKHEIFFISPFFFFLIVSD